MLRLPSTFGLFAFFLLGGLTESGSAQSEPEQREWMYRQYLQLHEFVRGGDVKPRWLDEGAQFWFVEHGADGGAVYLVDPLGRTQRHLFDLSSLREGLQRVLEEGTPAEGLPWSCPFSADSFWFETQAA